MVLAAFYKHSWCIDGCCMELPAHKKTQHYFVKSLVQSYLHVNKIALTPHQIFGNQENRLLIVV